MLTEGQEKAYNFIKDRYENGKKYAVLTGQAGTGKTFLTKKIFNDIFKGSTAGVTVSHKAKNILSKSIASDNIDIMTYAMAMGKLPDIDYNTGLTVFKNIGEPKICHSNYFVDECSMFSPDMEKEFEEQVKESSFLSDHFILYVGDHHQLPAIDNQNIEFSQLFSREGVVRLDEIVRQEEDNPIRPLTQATAKCIDTDRQLMPLISSFKGDFNKEKQQGVVITKNPNDIAKTYVNAFKDNVAFGEMNKMVIIAYKNDTVSQLNNNIRRYLGFTKEFEKGDIIMTSSNYKLEDDTYVQNGEEYWVEDVRPDIIEQIPVWILSCFRKENGKKIQVQLPVVMKAHFKDYKKRKDALVTTMKQAPPGKRGYYKKKIKTFTDKFCYVQHAHALTAYKAQGSTIHTVFFNLTDVLSVGPLNNLRKLQSIYVGLTRASNRLVIY